MTNNPDSEVRFLMGNEAIGRGIIEAGCSVATAYPGTPSSEILESLTRWKKELNHPIYLEWSVNEKIAFEVAYGASLSGSRAAVAMKMVGLNVASDPLTSAAYLGVRGGLVVVVADDPGPHSSQTEQDSRFFAWFAKVPVLDPGTPVEAREMAVRAFELSEKYEIPVILRPCLRVCHARQNVELTNPKEAGGVGPFKKNWTRWAAIPKYRFVLHGELNEKLNKIRTEEPEAHPKLLLGTNGNKLAFITSGSVSSHVRDIISSNAQIDNIDLYKIDLPFPANLDALQAIVDGHEQTVVIEETYPVIELQIANRTKTLGRLSGLVPDRGELTPEIVEQIIGSVCKVETAPMVQPNIKPRRPSLCPGCPHRSAFYLIRNVFDKAIYSGDIGCYTLGINMGAVDTCLCMGASVGMAAGLSKAAAGDESAKVVATIGDSTFFHAGIPALVNAAHTGANFVLVVMDNAVTAMTGGQPTPATDYLADGAPAKVINMEKIIEACGIGFCEVVDPNDYNQMKDALVRANEHTYEQSAGVSVIVTRRPCVRMPGVVLSDTRYMVNDDCDRCMTCIRDLECPAVSFNKSDKKVEIDEDLCAGCGFCVSVCPSQAIEAKGGK